MKFRRKTLEKIEKHCLISWRKIILQEKEEKNRKERLKEDLREEFLIVKKFLHKKIENIHYIL